MKAQRGQVICPESHSKREVPQPRTESKAIGEDWCFLPARPGVAMPPEPPGCERGSRLHIPPPDGSGFAMALYQSRDRGTQGRKEKRCGRERRCPNSTRLCAPGTSLLCSHPHSLGTKPSCPTPADSCSRSALLITPEGNQKGRWVWDP